MKVVQSFSWAQFCLCESLRTFSSPLIFSNQDPLFAVVIAFLVVLNIGLGAYARGYKEVWNGSISDLGWYGEEAGDRGGAGYGGGVNGYGGSGNGTPGVSYTYPNVQSFGGSQPVYQLPGHSVVITNGPQGQHSKCIGAIAAVLLN